MMTLRTGITACVAVGLIALLSVPAGAQGTNGNAFQNWNFLGGGARARGMGGAYLGVSDDAFAGTWNPAGLVYNEGVLLSMNYSYSRVGLDLDYGPAGQSVLAAEGDENISNISAAAFISPLAIMEKEFIVSVFYNRVQDVYTRSFFSADLDPVLGSPFEAAYGMNGNLAAAGAAFGTTIYKRLSVGASLSIMTGDGLEYLRTDIDSTRDTSAYNQMTTWLNSSDLDYSGLSAAISALYRTERWSAGLVITPAYTLTQSVDYYAVRRSVHNQIEESSRPVYGPLHGTEREINVPYSVGLGGSYKLTDNILLAADYQYRAFNADDKLEEEGLSNFRFQESPSEPNSVFEEMPVSWYNLHQVRIGAEYKRETSWGMVPIRVGLRNDPMLFGDPQGNDLYFDQRLDSGKAVEFPYYSLVNRPTGTGDQINAWTVTLGSGVHWSQIRLDAALELTSFVLEEAGGLYSVQRCPSCLITDPGVTVDKWDKRKTSYWGDYTRTYDISKVRFLFNFTGYF
jgi:opacity protein-like surface antigen